MDKSYNNIDKTIENMKYSEFLEYLKNQIGNFFLLAERGKYVRYSGRIARKHSVEIRKLFKIFRKKSLLQDSEITNLVNASKEEIKKLGEDNNANPEFN